MMLPAGAMRRGLIQVSPMGNMGNRMIQYMAALALQALVPGSTLAQIHLPEWGIQIPPVPEGAEAIEVVHTPALNLPRLANRLATGVIDRVDIRSYAQRLENLLSAPSYASLFHPPAPDEASTAPPARPDELVCNIRQGDILDGHHPDYVLVPIDFYAELCAATGLSPLFIGQLEDSPYMRALRRRFPRARYVPSQGGVADFTFIRRATHIVPAISTFSWLAAWLSNATRIYLPVLGHLHPLQARSAHLLPLDDPRYRFYLFPHHYAAPVAQYARAHAPLKGQWRLMPPARLRTLLDRAPPPRDRAAYLDAFEEDFYLAAHPDIAAAVADGTLPNGRHHYECYGFTEGRQGFPLDSAWYCRTYPLAALELGQGDAHDPADHWMSLGRARDYQRTPA